MQNRTKPGQHPMLTTSPPLQPRFATAWSAALDSIGYPFCLTVAVWDKGAVVNQTQVHPGGATNIGGGGGSPGGGITPPVIKPPSITFNDAN